jgi:hypothetical protein
MINKHRWRVAGVIATIVLTSPGHAAGHTEGSFSLSVRVPEACDIEAMGFQAQAGSGLVVGQVMEACNHNKGFQILASHRSLAEQERVDVDYGGVLTHLDRSGLSPIAFRAGPRFGAVPVKIAAHNLTQVLQVSFSLTAV